MIAKHRSPTALLGFGSRLSNQFGKAVSIEDVITQNQCTGILTNEILADDKGLRQTVRGRLLGIADGNAKIRSVSQQTLKVG